MLIEEPLRPLTKSPVFVDGRTRYHRLIILATKVVKRALPWLKAALSYLYTHAVHEVIAVRFDYDLDSSASSS